MKQAQGIRSQVERAAPGSAEPILLRRKIERVAFWQNMASHHQAPVLEAIARKRNIQVDWIVGNRLEDTARADQGWPEVDFRLVRSVYAPDHDIPSLVRQKRDATLHVFSGVYFNPTVREGYIAALRQGAMIAKMSESPPPPGLVLASEKMTLAKRLRVAMPVVHRLERAVFGNRLLFQLCIGHRSMSWWQSVGYPDAKLYPWAYIPPDLQQSGATAPNERFRFVYLGELSTHKGVDTIIDAAVSLSHLDFTLDLYGKGPLQESIEQKLAAAGLADRVKVQGFRPWAEAMQALASADASLVPSRYDGWGAVTTESLVRGTPVIVGDGAGSAILVKGPQTGLVVSSGSVEGLAQAMAQMLARGPQTQQTRAGLRDWAGCLDPDRMADYFWNVVDHTLAGGPAPSAPWDPQATA